MTAEAKAGKLTGIEASRAHALDQSFDRTLINEAFTRLHPSHRQLIHKAYYLQWTTGEIAADLNITEPAVKSRLHHALRTLHHTLNDLTSWSEAR